MKLHKVELYVLDFDDWDDDHELNMNSATREQFLKYFLTKE